MTTTVEQQVSDNRVTGHHAWDRVCVNSVAAKRNQQNRNARRASGVEQWSSRVEQPSDRPAAEQRQVRDERQVSDHDPRRRDSDG